MMRQGSETKNALPANLAVAPIESVSSKIEAPSQLVDKSRGPGTFKAWTRQPSPMSKASPAISAFMTAPQSPMSFQPNQTIFNQKPSNQRMTALGMTS